MRILAAAATFIIVASSAAGAVPATGTSLQAGDTLVYDVTIELQQHHVESGAKNKDTSSEASGHGTETISIYAIGKDGTAYATVEANFKGTDNGRAVDFDVKFQAKVLPDGQLRTKSQLGGGISEAINFANTTMQEIDRHTLQLGSTWKSAQNSPYLQLTLARTISGQKLYQGYPAVEVQSTGAGTVSKTNDGKPASGTIAVSGTSYYDGKDHLLLGEALRTLTVVKLSSSPEVHVNYSAMMNMALSTWTHAQPTRSIGVSASNAPGNVAAPSATPASAPAPLPIPTAYAPTPYPTVTPRLGY